jgi:hypothetical protein
MQIITFRMKSLIKVTTMLFISLLILLSVFTPVCAYCLLVHRTKGRIRLRYPRFSLGPVPCRMQEADVSNTSKAIVRILSALVGASLPSMLPVWTVGCYHLSCGDSIPLSSCILNIIPAAVPVPSALGRNLPESYGASKRNIGQLVTLIPIAKIDRNVRQAINILSPQKVQLVKLKALFNMLPTTERAFKATFDEYSTDISYKQKFLDQNGFLVYYTNGFDGPNRSKIDSDDRDPTSDVYKQEAQYGARNDAWVAIDDARSELEYLLTAEDDEVDISDLRASLDKAAEALQRYLSFAPADQRNALEKEGSMP